jgi:hypothetical protein
VDNNYLDLGMNKSGFVHTLPSGRLTTTVPPMKVQGWYHLVENMISSNHVPYGTSSVGCRPVGCCPRAAARQACCVISKPATGEGMDKSTLVHTQIQIIIIHFLPSPFPPIPNG